MVTGADGDVYFLNPRNVHARCNTTLYRLEPQGGIGDWTAVRTVDRGTTGYNAMSSAPRTGRAAAEGTRAGPALLGALWEKESSPNGFVTEIVYGQFEAAA